MLPLMARLALLTLAALAAGCSGGGGDDDYPIGGGGTGGGTTGPRTDGGTRDGGGGDGQATIGGRVCLLSDLRRLIGAAPGDCAATGAAGLAVSLGGSTPVLTAADGSFTIPAQEGSNLSWRVTGAGLITSIVPVSAAAPLLPAIRDVDYLDLLNSNSVLVDQGEGSIVARVLRGGVPVMNATAQVAGGESLQTLYDGPNAIVWPTIATGPLGVAWLPDNAAGARTLQLAQGTTQLAVPVTITDQAITFVTIALP
jgi:hypothetical protein